ncbi:MAG: AAA family ATPase [Chthoniobacterales bacterium]
MSERIPPIRPELIAAKIEKLRNFELPELFDEFTDEPRFIRALLFLQYVSKPDNYPGGLTKFAEDFCESCRDQVGTVAMIAANPCGARYNADDAIAVFAEMSSHDREQIFGRDDWIFENAFGREVESRPGRVTFERVIETWGLSSLIRHDVPEGEDYRERRDEDELQTWTGTISELRRLLIEKLTPAAARELCLADARESLAGYFKELCELPHVGFGPNRNHFGAPRYFAAIGPALLEFIERRAERLKATIADTEVTRLVFRWMQKARSMSEPVMISGNSRFGKTEALRLCCKMDPGNFRLVDTPASNSIGDLLREVARSLGLNVDAKNSVRDLREQIDYVLRFSGLTLCFDEWQFGLPTNYSRNTAPGRLNWVRRAVLDRGLAAVFVCTPQSYQVAKKRFVKVTAFAMEQFDERILKTVHLPNELSEADALAVARIHFIGMPDEIVRIVACAALATERNYVSDISKIATLAKDNAREEGRERPLLRDIEAAIADVLPAPAVRPAERLKKAKRSAPMQPRCTGPAAPLQMSRISPVDLKESHRGMQPLAMKK